MENSFTMAAYVVAGVLFILSLGGLSGQESAKRAVWYGIVGMAVAVIATLVGPGAGLWLLSLVLIAAGGTIGYYVAMRVQMTEMPQLVAAMHSLVGLAAVFVGFNAEMTINLVEAAKAAGDGVEGAFALLVAKKEPIEIAILKIELSLGIWIGAVTFTGSVIAYGKLAGKVTSAATKLPGGHLLNAAAALLSIVCLVWYLNSGAVLPLLILTAAALFIGYHLIMGIGGADMPVVVSMLNSYSGWAAAAIGFSLGNDLLIVVGALVGSSVEILSFIMCKAMNRSFFSVILGGFGVAAGPAM
jgi:NAD(P) transhydrogenase subunit beta